MEGTNEEKLVIIKKDTSLCNVLVCDRNFTAFLLDHKETKILRSFARNGRLGLFYTYYDINEKIIENKCFYLIKYMINRGARTACLDYFIGKIYETYDIKSIRKCGLSV